MQSKVKSLRNRILSLFLTMCMVLVLLPGAVFAAGDININVSHIGDQGAPGWHWNASDKIFSINGALAGNISFSGGTEDVTMAVYGVHTLTGGITCSTGNLTIINGNSSGDQLTINAGDNYGVYSVYDLDISGLTLNATTAGTQRAAVFIEGSSDSSFTMSSGTLDFQTTGPNSDGISVNGSGGIDLSGTATITGAATGNGLAATTVTVSGGTVDVSASGYAGIFAAHELTVSDGAVTAKGNSSSPYGGGVYTDYDEQGVSVTGGSLTTGTADGADGNITGSLSVAGGTVTVNGAVKSNGSDNPGELIVSNGTATVSGTVEDGVIVTGSGSATVAGVNYSPMTVASVTVSPAAPAIAPGASALFAAEVAGANNPFQGVTWSVSGGASADTEIYRSGLLEVGGDEAMGTTLTVTATSRIDNTTFGTATVTVGDSQVPGGGGRGRGRGRGSTTTTTAPPAATPESWVSGATATITVTPTVSADGKATAAVTPAQMTEILSQAQAAAAQTGAKPKIEIKLGEGEGTGTEVSTVETTLPAASIQAMASAGVDSLTLSSSLGTVTLDAAALSTISGLSAGDITVSVAKADPAFLSADVRQAVGDRPVYDFSITSGEKTISQFNGAVTVAIPYVPAAGEDSNAIVVYYINDQGQLETITNGKYDAAGKTVVFTTDHFSTYAAGYNKINFTDVNDSAWYAQAVSYMAARGITSGTEGNRFSPDAALTRGQFVTLLMRAYDISPDASPSDNFTDSGNTYYTGYLAAAKGLGITKGIGDNKFAPEQAITRQDMFTLLYNALKTINKLPQGNSGQTLNGYTDKDNVAVYAQEAMGYLVETGTISGSGGKLTPTATTTRAQMTQVLYNLLAK